MPEETIQPQIRVIVSGHLPPPLGGMASYYQTLLGSSLRKRVDLRFVQTSSNKRRPADTGSFTVSNFFLAIRDCLRFAWSVLWYRPQICHIGTAAGLSFFKHGVCVAISRILRTKVLLQPHCSFAAMFAGHSHFWSFAVRKIVSWTDAVLVLSQEWFQLSTDVPGSVVHYLPIAINVHEYCHIAEARFSNPDRNVPFRILYLGHLGQAKGTFDLISAAQKISATHPNVVFDLVGEELSSGDREQLCRQIADKNLDCVHVHPPVQGAAKHLFFRYASIFVYPSYFEGMPISVLEAMACGLPIVATSVGGLPELVIHESNGLLVDAGQPDQLAAALCRLLDDLELCKAMQQQSYSFVVDRFNVENHVAKLLVLYRKTISANHNG
jgi:glycosyltransferase involved in cell wall biosynthesis